MKAIIIGGGIIGLNTAYYLNKSGWDVTIADSNGFSDNCSYGNLGMIVPSHFVPLAMPGMVSQGVKWMFNKKSPFYVKPAFNAGLVKWGLKFIKSATLKNVENARIPLKEMNVFSKALYEEIALQKDFDFAFEEKGIIMYFKTDGTANEEIHLAEQAKQMGLDVAVLNKQELHVLEPDARPDVLGGVHYRCDAHLHPGKLMPQLIAHLKKNGVSFLSEKISGIYKSGNKITAIEATSGKLSADLFVFATGSQLPALAKMAGLNLPLMPGKGYSFTNKKPLVKLNIPAILCEARVAITPMDSQMRYGGTMEIGSINNNINMNRVEGIVNSIPSYFSGLKVSMPQKEDVWFGFRPCSPDGLPYIGKTKKYANLLIGGAHAMMGQSLGPATGKILSQLANETTPEINISVFNPDRF